MQISQKSSERVNLLIKIGLKKTILMNLIYRTYVLPGTHYTLLQINIVAAVVAAKSLQLCLTLCDPIDGSPPGSPIPGILQARIMSGLPFPSPMHESEKWKWSRSVVSNSLWPHGLQPTGSYMGFFRQEYWSGLPLPSPNIVALLCKNFIARHRILLTCVTIPKIQNWCHLKIQQSKQRTL